MQVKREESEKSCKAEYNPTEWTRRNHEKEGRKNKEKKTNLLMLEIRANYESSVEVAIEQKTKHT